MSKEINPSTLQHFTACDSQLKHLYHIPVPLLLHVTSDKKATWLQFTNMSAKGEKNNGFDVLYQNMKSGYDASKEFADFLRESCSVEETYAKLLSKLAKFASNCGTKGSFSPYWNILKTLVEKLANVHQQLVFSWQDLAKDVHRYTDEQHKKHKSMKESEASTLETVQCIQQTISALQKAKETYHVRSSEFEKLKRENASPKEVEKAETKYKKAYDDYKSLVEKYSNVRNEFDTKMSESCQRFQDLEEYHLVQMKDFVDTYSKAWEHHHVLLGQIHEEFRSSNYEMSLEKLLNLFIESKNTGTEKPGPIEFEEAEMAALPLNNTSPETEIPVIDKPRIKEGVAEVANLSPPVTDPSGKTSPWTVQLRNTGWFLSKRRKEKRKEKKKKKEKDKENESEEKKETPAVDDEGYSIPPESRLDNNADRDSWYSSSDSESDNESKTAKINVKINPVDQNGSGVLAGSNTDALYNIVENLRLSPLSNQRHTPTNEMKKSSSVSDSISNSSFKANIDQMLSSTTSSPTEIPFGSPTTAHNHSHTSNSSHNFSLSDLNNSNSSGSLRSSQTAQQQRSQTPTTSLSGSLNTVIGGGAAPLLPGPPPPTRARSTAPASTSVLARPAGRVSPAFGGSVGSFGGSAGSFERVDSVASMDKVSFNSNPYLGSRGPSPLTIGMADNIPLAVAFSETANALFKGTDTDKCRVKLTGDLMLSFPAGIVKVLMDNPNPASLSFTLRNTHKLENILVNKQLVREDQKEAESCTYSFDMTALTDHLRKQAEHTNKASYFNIDILKYQVRTSGMQNTPLHLVSYWKCEPTSTDFRLDYSYNGAAMATNLPLSNVSIILPVNGQVNNAQMQPLGNWCQETKRATWRIAEISPLNANGQGSLRGKFDAVGCSPSTTAVQFLCEGTTLSGLDFELTGMGYRLSLIKKRFITGKYICEAESDIQMV